MNTGSLVTVLIVAAALGFAGYKIGQGRGRAGLGAVLGFMLGLIGLLILICIPRTAESKAARAAQAAPAAQQEPVVTGGLRPPGSGPDGRG